MNEQALRRIARKDANPLLPYDDTPGDNVHTKPWTARRLRWWAKSQALGIQYYTGYGPVYCPPRNWDSK